MTARWKSLTASRVRSGSGSKRLPTWPLGVRSDGRGAGGPARQSRVAPSSTCTTWPRPTSRGLFMSWGPVPAACSVQAVHFMPREDMRASLLVRGHAATAPKRRFGMPLTSTFRVLVIFYARRPEDVTTPSSAAETSDTRAERPPAGTRAAPGAVFAGCRRPPTGKVVTRGRAMERCRAKTLTTVFALHVLYS